MGSRVLFPAPLILYTFAAYVFGLLVFLQTRQYRLRRPAWGGWAWRTLSVVFGCLYVGYLAGYVSMIATDGISGEMPLAFRLMLRAGLPLVAPLLVQVFYAVERERLRAHAFWRALVALEYVVAGTVAVCGVLLDVNLLPPWADRLAGHLPTLSDSALASAGLAAAAISWSTRLAGDSPLRRRQRRWNVALLCTLEGGFVARALWDAAGIGVFLGLLPVAFTLVTVYYGERLAFWDVFAKRGLFFFLALLALTGHIALLGPYLDLAILDFARSWIIALSIVPMVAAGPWAYSRLNDWVDRAWLGRRFSAVEAVRHFSESVQSAVDEDDLVERAEGSLREIFSSDARVMRGGDGESGVRLSSPLCVSGAAWGEIRVMPRPDEVPFLSQDRELLGVLARSLSAAIESETLRAQKQLQQRRERELALSAAQSELKALRAQINPHFLFNALNTIASLIPREPDLAEQTVEQLSEVFRYTVRHSEREWVRMEDEIAFVSAYLDIEQARFGERLRVRLDIAPEAREVRIPAMVVQTLVENAVKHGVAAVRGPGSIAVSARVADGILRLRVEDSGPGFCEDIRPDALPESSRGGYGLRNVRERLRAYYGPSATLTFGRTPAGLTEVGFEIPVNGSGATECAS